ncbi:hypothetical protein HOLleu_23500 [Holothuria leucospilota]|uniref:Uncharacterized protein n=1 Tax=Holothuria leucospilota TaxID=206669 RepID=A0A9Q1BVH7_HOLLE|nr:hypothetical protein HOLleu_23500 [Holothuria leucospilota]
MVGQSVTYIFVLLWGSSTAFVLPNVGLMSPIQNLARMDIADLTESPTAMVDQVNVWLGNQRRNGQCPVPNPQDTEVKSCPWKQVTDEDENRLPRIITKAVCQCSSCLNFNTGERTPSLGYCQEVVRPVVVQRRLSPEQEFVMDIELVPQACICNTSTESYPTAFVSYLQSKIEEEKGWLEGQPKNCHNNHRRHGKVCPWDLVHDEDENRVPRVIKKAVCQCEDCNGWGGKCQEVMKPRRVVRRESMGSPYYMDIEVVPVACECSVV